MSPAPRTQGHQGQELVYTFGEGMTLKAAEAIKMVLDERAACMANRTYHVHPHTGDTWHYAFPEDDGMGSVASLPKCVRGKALRYRPSSEWPKNGCERREVRSTENGQWGPFGVRGIAGKNG